jgi:hypothetical protein
MTTTKPLGLRGRVSNRTWMAMHLAAALSACTGMDDPDSGALNDAAVQVVADAMTEPDAGSATVPDAELGRPCLQVTPSGEAGLDFGPVPVDGRLRKRITLTSCGDAPVSVLSVAFGAGAPPELRVVEESVPELPASLPAATPDDADPGQTIEVECGPTAAGPLEGWLEIASDDPVSPLARVHVTCEGVEPPCPVPAVAVNAFTVSSLDIVDLDASPSTDAVQYRWDVIEAPAGSTSHPVERLENDPRAPLEGVVNDDLQTPSARFLVDVVGQYTLALFVRSRLDIEAPSQRCPAPEALVHIEASPSDGFRIELSWHTPGDPNETDTAGTDLNLHLVHPKAPADGWQGGPLDCSFTHPTLDWGAIGDPTDDPSLDLNDVDGAGPETVTLLQPEDTDALDAPYRVGVDYYRDQTAGGESFGPSDATVRIYLAGALAWQNDFPRTLPQRGAYWDVAWIFWGAERSVQVVDQVSTP